MLWLGFERLKIGNKDFPPQLIDSNGWEAPKWLNDYGIWSPEAKNLIFSRRSGQMKYIRAFRGKLNVAR